MGGVRGDGLGRFQCVIRGHENHVMIHAILLNTVTKWSLQRKKESKEIPISQRIRRDSWGNRWILLEVCVEYTSLMVGVGLLALPTSVCIFNLVFAADFRF